MFTISRRLALGFLYLLVLVSLGWWHERIRSQQLLAVVRQGQLFADRALRAQILAEGKLNAVLNGQACSY
jgi:hypothetical protein